MLTVPPKALAVAPDPPRTPPRSTGLSSPTKRVHASPSPNSSPSLRQGEPSTRHVYLYRAAQGAPGTSEVQGVVGLGVGMMVRNPYEQRDVSAEKEGVKNPDEQTRRLMDMPVALSNALSRLSSQHHLSEYNTLKRVMMANGNSSTPPLSSSNNLVPPMPRPAPSRSQSTPSPIAIDSEVGLMAIITTGEHDGTQSVPIVSRSVTPTIPSATSAETALSPIVLSMSLASPEPLVPAVPETNVAKLVAEALSSNIARPVAGKASSCSTTTTPSETTIALPGMLPGMQMMNGFAVKTSASHPMNISTIVPIDVLALLSSHLLPIVTPILKSPLTPSKSINTLDTSSSAPFIIEQPLGVDLWDLTRYAPPAVKSTDVTIREVPSGRQLGNFFLSSCPGKKVRLEPSSLVKGGRGGICRDLRADLKKAHDEGVRLIICCLDDQELSFLGAPWNEYAQAAASLSLPVIRIPMYEGYAPSSPSELDDHLSRIVRLHTLRGEGVLAHCRGGIGRAGLVAACWMIKMGFIGAGQGGTSMQVVERVIDVVRRRRSVKSIESTQQVAFLLEYVEYLHHQGQIVKALEMV